MSERKYYEIPITVYSYKEELDEFQRKNDITYDEVVRLLTCILQTDAWADAYKEMQGQLDWENSEEGKKYIAEQEAKEAD